MLEQNVRAIEKEIRTLCYFSNGSVIYENAIYMSPYERNEWIKFINEINAERKNMYVQEQITEL